MMVGTGVGVGAGAPWGCDWRRAVLDEVALEGLEGISIEGLWTRLRHRLSCDLHDKMKMQYWKFLIASPTSVQFYELPVPALEVKVLDRFSYADENSAVIEPPEYIDGPYVYNPIPREYGSSQFYYARKEIMHVELSRLTYQEVVQRWGGRLVIVASRDLRWSALAPHLSVHSRINFKPAQYCLLELIGKARENGQLTTGLTNVSKIAESAKTLFYLRKLLQAKKLITYVNFMIPRDKEQEGRATQSILLRLTRFHKPKIMTLPRTGFLYKMINQLRDKPDQTESLEPIRKSLGMSCLQMKKFMNRQHAKQYVKLKEGEMEPALSKRKNKHFHRYAVLDVDSDSTESDMDEIEPPVKCQFKLGVSLLRQAYHRILETGQEGITQIELSRMLELDFSRSSILLRNLQRSKAVRCVNVDRGRQRVGKFIAMAATPENSNNYAQEKEKLLQYLKSTPEPKSKLYTSIQKSSQKDETPANDMFRDMTSNIIEIRHFEQITHQPPFSKCLTGKGQAPTLRQIMFTNGIIKSVREKEIMHGVQELNSLVSKETCVEMMDGKSLRRILQRLIEDNQIRFYKMQWPNKNHHSVFICAPYITIDHPLLTMAYKDVCLRAYRLGLTVKGEKKPQPSLESLDKDHTYPRYLRAKELHEFVFKCAYGEDGEKRGELPPGILVLVNVIPEMTIDLAVGHICSKSAELRELANNPEILPVKVKNAPPDICQTVLSTTNLIQTIKRTLRMLSAFGLIQLCNDAWDVSLDYSVSYLSKYIFYVNRHAKIFDTRGSWPDPNNKPVQNKYHFQTIENVTEFWTTVQNISTNTKITLAARNKVPPVIRICAPEEAPLFDNGDDILCGDGLGPCGYDSIYYLDIPHLWCTLGLKSTTMTSLKRKMTDLHKYPVTNNDVPKKRNKLTIEQKKAALPIIRPIRKKKYKSSKLVKTKKLVPPGLRRRERTGSLVKWTPIEDKILVWCRIAKNIMSPSPVQGVLQITNLVARDIVSRVADPKTAQTCDSRAKSLERDNAILRQKEKLINEIRRRPPLVEKYENLCKKLRIKNSGQFGKYMKEGRLRMLEFVWHISSISASQLLSRSVPCIANNLQDLLNRFIVHINTDKIMYAYLTPEDIQQGLLREGIIQTMTSLMDIEPSVDFSMLIYDIFKVYPEVPLRNALEDLRKSSAVSVRDKSQTNRMKKLSSLSTKEVVSYSSSHKISAAYLRRWLNIHSTNFPEAIVKRLQTMTPSDDVSDAAEITCILLELNTTDDVEIFLSKNPVVKSLSGFLEPDEALADIDEKVSVSLQRGKIGWRLKNQTVNMLNELYDDIVITNETSSICSKSVCVAPMKYETTEIQDKIISILNGNKELGATFGQLLETCGVSTEVLQDNLKILETKHVIRNVGYDDNRIVLHSYTHLWSLAVNNKRLCPSPWITIQGELKTSVFVGWCGAVLQKIMDFPGCSVAKIAESCDFLTPKNVEDICQFLASLDCVKIQRIVISEAGLFADDETLFVMDDMYEYMNPECILVFPLRDTTIRYALVKKKVLEYEA